MADIAGFETTRIASPLTRDSSTLARAREAQMRFIPDETYVAALARYRSKVRRLEAGNLVTKELLARSKRALSKSRELLATPAPKVWLGRQGFNLLEDKNPTD